MTHMRISRRSSTSAYGGTRQQRRGPRVLTALFGLLASLVVVMPLAHAACANAIACENERTGTPSSQWQIDGAGDLTIQGFGTRMSLQPGETIDFKIKTDASAYTVDILRLGYYQGNGARRVGAASTPVAISQPDCLTDPATQIFDCGNWAVSSYWTAPTDAVSGVYIALLTRTDTGGQSHIPFILRNDASHSDILFQTADTTWQAYNSYGGASFYGGAAPVGRAYKLSYNRPFNTRANAGGRDFLFGNEYPMIQFLESNGFDVSYTSGIDTDLRGDLLRNHKVFYSVGHDEYWSGPQRANIEAARDAGVNLAFFAGNEIYWRTRWENSIDGTGTTHRTLVCYKETWANAKIDPSPEWTGTWRDPRFASQANGGGLPENALVGTLYMSNDTSLPIKVSFDEGKNRFWRNTSLANLTPGTTATLSDSTIGYESNEDVDNGFRPAGVTHLSTTTGAALAYLTDFGNTTAAGTTTHHLTQYRAPSGALVFSAGSIQWSWGLEAEHDGAGAVDPRMRQAMINLMADMGVQPTTLVSGLVAATKTTDTTAPTAAIATPAAGASLPNGTSVTVTGTASDVGGRVAGVEVSTDGGSTWHPATGTTSWTYTYVQAGAGPAASIQVRATDDSQNIGSVVTQNVATACPCSIFGASVPKTTDAGSDGMVNLGVRFRARVDGFVLGVRFYKSLANTGSHTGALWSPSGTLMASGTFANETASGWQELRFAAPVAISVGQTYVASYVAPSGHYAYDPWTFSTGDIVAAPLTAPRSQTGAGNGVFEYGSQRFPTQSMLDVSYGVDVVFDNQDTFPPAAQRTTPLNGSSSVATTVIPSVDFTEAIQPSTLIFTLTSSAGTAVSGVAAYDLADRRATFTPSAALAFATQYTASVTASDLAGNATAAPIQWSFATARADNSGAVCPCAIFSDSNVPETVTVNEGASLELGTRFSSDADGVITGVRFYKGPQNVGPHTGSLWTTSGTRLATVSFVNESSTGWQEAVFSQPVSVTADMTYIVSYSTTVGYYSANWGMFATTGVDRYPLHVRTGGGAYRYGGGFPDGTSDANYWVDAIFMVPDSMPPVVASVAPSQGADNVPTTSTVKVTFAQPVQPGSAVVTVAGPSGSVGGTATYDQATKTATWTPSAAMPAGAQMNVSVGAARNLGGTPMSAPAQSSFTTVGETACPCALFSSDAVPLVADSGDGSALTLGVKFVPSVSGHVTGVRFYKSAANVGTHTASLWSATGTRLATVTFTNETASGWQTALFGQSVNVQAGTTYVAAYDTGSGRYAIGAHVYDDDVVVGPLTAPGSANGVFASGVGRFPNESFNSSTYYVTPLFMTGIAADVTPPSVTSRTPAPGAVRVPVGTTVTAVMSEPVASGSVTLRDSAGATVAGTSSYDATMRTFTFSPAAPLAASTTFTAAVQATDTSGNAMAAPDTWTFTTFGPRTCPCSLFAEAESPASPTVFDAGGQVQLGVAFTPAANGQVTSVRFWKQSNNTGTHTGSLWTSAGQQLATGTFTNETTSGWQTLTFATPVAVTTGTTYIASYVSPTGNWSATFGQFDTSGLDWPPLSVPTRGGRFVYGTGFPAGDSGTNYWVDVVFIIGGTTPQPDTTAPVVSGVTATPTGSTATVTWTTDESATSVVDYGTTSALGSSVTGTVGTSHSVTLTGLSSATTYYYRVRSADAAGNVTTSPVVTAAPASFVSADTVAPAIATVVATPSGQSATVTWTTDEPSTSRVDYGTTTSLGTSATGASGTTHSVTLTGLTPGTQYHYRVSSSDPAGNASTAPVAADPPSLFTTTNSTPPSIAAVTATQTSSGATVTWTTEKSATSRVDYGTSATALTLNATGATATAHSVDLTALTPNTRYYYRVTSVDGTGGSATWPDPAQPPASFAPSPVPVVTDTAADLSTGTTANTTVGTMNSGVVTLQPAYVNELNGTTLSSGLSATALATGGTTVVGGGTATLIGTRVVGSSTYPAGTSVTWYAKLAASDQQLGWYAGGNKAALAAFSRDSTGALTVVTNDGGANNQTTPITATIAPGPHEYRIDWTNGNVAYLVDGVQVATSAFAPAGRLSVMAADATVADGGMPADWVRVAPFAASGTYTTKVIDAGARVGWDSVLTEASIPTGTTLTVRVRSGEVATPDGTWSAWTTVPAGGAIAQTGRYVQVQASMTSSGTRFATPILSKVSLNYHVI